MFAIEYNQKFKFLIQFDIKNKPTRVTDNKDFKEVIRDKFESLGKYKITVTQYQKFVRLDIEVDVENCSDVVREVKLICLLDSYSLY